MYNYLDNALIVGLGGEVGEDPGRLEDGGGVVTCNDVVTLMMLMMMLIIMMMMTWARDLDRAPLRGGGRGVAPTRDLDQRSLQ